MNFKKIIIKKIKDYIQKKTIKLEGLFGKETTTEQDLFNLVKEIHQAALQLRDVKQDNFEYVQQGNGYFFYINEKRFFLGTAKGQHNNYT